MRKQIFTMLTGLLIGAALTGGSAAVAAGAYSAIHESQRKPPE